MRLREDEQGVMQVVEAMLALSILILAISWAVTVSQRPSDPPGESDELRTLTRQAFELMDAVDSADPRDTVREYLEDCDDRELLASALLDILGDASVNIFVDDDTTTWIGSAYASDGGPVQSAQPLGRGFETSVVRYLAEADMCDDGQPASILSVRVEVWR